jgi:hypothetical protein
MIFLGIQVDPGRVPLAFSAMDDEPRLLALSGGSLADLLSYASGLPEALVCVGAPLRPNIGIAHPDPASSRVLRRGRRPSLRQAELDLEGLGLHLPHTPPSPRNAPSWMRRSFQIFERFSSMGYVPFTGDKVPRGIMESQAEAGYHTLLQQLPLASATLEGRLQRQMVLFEQGVPVSDPMGFVEEITPRKLLKGNLPLEMIASQPELDALLMAYTAWLAWYKPDQVRRFGLPDEGEILLPGDLPDISAEEDKGKGLRSFQLSVLNPLDREEE